jgi:hypothetical protein
MQKSDDRYRNLATNLDYTMKYNPGTNQIDGTFIDSSPYSTNTNNIDNSFTSNLSGNNSQSYSITPNSVDAIVATGITKDKLIANLIYLVIYRFYYIIAIPALIITYNFFKALNTPNKDGISILDRIAGILNKVLDELVSISGDCPTLIGDFHKFIECLGF